MLWRDSNKLHSPNLNILQNHCLNVQIYKLSCTRTFALDVIRCHVGTQEVPMTTHLWVFKNWSTYHHYILTLFRPAGVFRDPPKKVSFRYSQSFWDNWPFPNSIFKLRPRLISHQRASNKGVESLKKMFSILNRVLSWALTSFGNKFCLKKRSRLIKALDNRFTSNLCNSR